MSLVPPPTHYLFFFLDRIQTSSMFSPPFYHVTNRATWQSPWMPFACVPPPITHSAVPAGSERRRGGDACAPGRSHSTRSGGAPSASSSRPPFGSRRVAATRSTPGEAQRHCKTRPPWSLLRCSARAVTSKLRRFNTSRTVDFCLTLYGSWYLSGHSSESMST